MSPSQIIIFDQPRSASHLLQRILSKQPKLKHASARGFLGDARGQQVGWLMQENWKDGMSAEDEAKFRKQIEESAADWMADVKDCQKKGLISVPMDHPISAMSPQQITKFIQTTPDHQGLIPQSANPTILPDELLLYPGTVPILTIRNPRLSVPSAYRVLNRMGLPHGSGRPNFLISTATFWNRLLYEYYTANGIQPLVIDADDVITSRDFSRQLCSKLGLDPELAHFQWERGDKEKYHPMEYASQTTLIESSGIDQSKAAKNLDLDELEKKWDEEFGEDASLIREAVAAAMPDYEWLFERKLKF
ncbi:hypothetical protein HII31_04079 [Pseudocercospora fuligena]|uniref:Uncharacterized protein n=1 Tax=Pseudocercospora fuligena TaxID=685502 RepID=A0A8H6RPJ5_9PEZI|nr:hypothetical protein HII31_04079 [Pseudocercospora fuligena]